MKVISILLLLMLTACGETHNLKTIPEEAIAEIQLREITEVTPTFSPASQCSDLAESKTDFNTLSPGEQFSLSNIINLGKLTWTIIKENKPVMNIQQLSANALPQGMEGDQLTLECWKAPKRRTFEAKYLNGYGIEVVSFQFDVRYIYGGSYKGLGQYLKSVTITPSVVNVLFGYSFDANVTAPSIVNINTESNPIAGMEIQIGWTVSTHLKLSRRTMNFFVSGDGEFIDLNSK